MIGARPGQEHRGLLFGAGFRSLANAQNPPVLEWGRYEPGGCGLAVGNGVFHRSERGHAGTKRAYEHVAGAVRGNDRRRADCMVSHPPPPVAVDEAVASERNDQLPGDASA